LPGSGRWSTHSSGPREGDLDGLVAVLDPGVVLHIDAGARRPAASMTLHGAAAVAQQACTGLSGVLRVAQLHPALVNGAAGVIVTLRGRAVTVMGFTVSGGQIAAIDAIADPDRVARIAADVVTAE
jgi:hypothetical protein